MKYWIFKIIGIIGILFTPFIYLGYEQQHLAGSDSWLMPIRWLEGCLILLIVFTLITIAGFSRSIARLKALIDFHFDFDDDQDLDGYPKLYVFKIVRRVLFWVIIGAIVLMLVLSNWFSVFGTVVVYFAIAGAGLVVLLALINIIICLCKKIEPLYGDIGTIFLIVAIFLYFALQTWGVNYMFVMIINAPLLAVGLLYIFFSRDDELSAYEVFDWFCADEYNDYYNMLCEREKEQEAKNELSNHKQAKQKKIETTKTKIAEKKETKQVKKTEKKNAKSTKKTGVKNNTKNKKDSK